MKTIIKLTAILTVALLMAGCGESLEDTYKDYSGDGTSIRYTGRCRNISVTGGWQRIVVNWTNNVDPIIKNVKIVWKFEDEADSVYLPAGTTEYSIDHIGSEPLGDRSFEITLCSVSAQGIESLSDIVYGRPYTYTHEEVQAFNRLVSSAYKIHDRVVLTFLPWQEGISEAHLTYTKSDGSQGRLELIDYIHHRRDGGLLLFGKDVQRALEVSRSRTVLPDYLLDAVRILFHKLGGIRAAHTVYFDTLGARDKPKHIVPEHRIAAFCEFVIQATDILGIDYQDLIAAGSIVQCPLLHLIHLL